MKVALLDLHPEVAALALNAFEGAGIRILGTQAAAGKLRLVIACRSLPPECERRDDGLVRFVRPYLTASFSGGVKTERIDCWQLMDVAPLALTPA